MQDTITKPLLKWYGENKRVLPWREKKNPYEIWVSEIMLQQTRVEAVKPFYERFMRELPNVAALAVCPEEKLLKLWEGLGYYNRVRNMQKAAQKIMEVYDGVFPADYEALKGLPGIGNYTAGAVASIAFCIPVPAVDGNVLRVMARLREDGEDILKQSVKNRVEAELTEIMPAEDPGAFNQAMMDLGAMVCLPNGAPKCEVCPLFDQCLAGQHQTWTEYPFKKSAKPRRIEDRTVLLFLDGTHTAVRKRPKKGLLAGLYEFPNFDGVLSEQEALEEAEKFGVTPLHIQALPPYKHIFSHVEWHITGYAIKIAGNDVEQEGEEKAGLILRMRKPRLKDMPFRLRLRNTQIYRSGTCLKRQKSKKSREKKMKILSIAVPCYNSEAYMEKCIDSLLVGGEEVEILIVDDGSKDGTTEIADRYQEKYPTIVKAIHQENKGHGGAVNTGVENATGLYFKVVDSDDWVNPEAYQKILNVLAEVVRGPKTLDLLISNYVYEKRAPRENV